jgi:cytochrome c oxidase subunit I+III
MVILLAVDATVFASMAFAHLHVSMKLDVCPPPGAALPPVRWSVAAAVLWLASAAVMWGCRWLGPAEGGDASVRVGGGVAGLGVALRQRGAAGRMTCIGLVVVSVALALAGTAAQLAPEALAGLSPRANAWSATLAALLGYQALPTVVLVLMGGYLAARFAAGHVRHDARATLDNVALFWAYAGVQGALLAVGVPALAWVL